MAKVKQQTILKDLLSFQGSLNGKSKLLDQLRLEGAQAVKNTSFPGRKDEERRFINLRGLYKDNFVPADEIGAELTDISEFYIPESKGATLVFVNGIFSEELSSTEACSTEVTVCNFA